MQNLHFLTVIQMNLYWYWKVGFLCFLLCLFSRLNYVSCVPMANKSACALANIFDLQSLAILGHLNYRFIFQRCSALNSLSDFLEL